jgi:hypothetical protein
MSDTPQGPGWWQASDGKWYAPETAPGAPQPGFSQPGPQPDHSQPAYSQPAYSQPAYTQPGPQPGPQAGYSQPGPQPGYGQPGYSQPPQPNWSGGQGTYGGPPVYQPKPSNGIATAALVTGIIGLLTSWFVLGGVLGVIALVLGIVGVKKAREVSTGRGMAIAGIVLGILSIVVAIAVIVAAKWLVDNADELFEEVDPSQYQLTREECRVNGSTLTASGTITNLEDKSRRYVITVNSTGGVGTGTFATAEPGQTVKWSILSSDVVDLDGGECAAATEVRRAFQTD